MEHTTQTPEVYDFRQYDRIWQRVAPNLEPYPGMAVPPAGRSEAVNPPVPAAPAVPAIPAVPEAPAVPVPAIPEGQLPGAERNPCCMGTEAAELLAVEGLPSRSLLSLTLNSLHALDKLPEKPLPLVKAAFEWKAMALAGYEPLIDGCAVCGVNPPEAPRFHLREGVLHCAKCRGEVGEGISMPLSLPALAALEHIVHGDPKRLFSFRLDGEPLKELADAAEAYLHTQLERGFSTLDYYKSLQLS